VCVARVKLTVSILAGSQVPHTDRKLTLVQVSCSKTSFAFTNIGFVSYKSGFDAGWMSERCDAAGWENELEIAEDERPSRLGLGKLFYALRACTMMNYKKRTSNGEMVCDIVCAHRD
jgi:hypothetical protein